MTLNELKIGIIGLNTSFLQLSADKYQGKLALHSQQLHAVCDGNGPHWLKQHHTSLLMTHHPPEWLDKESYTHLNSSITAHGNFIAHLCGHLHETALNESSINGSEYRRIYQARSLFGLEYFKKKMRRSHGYTAGKLSFSGNNGNLELWPRMAAKQGGQWEFIPDPSQKIVDEHTKPISFTLNKI